MMPGVGFEEMILLVVAAIVIIGPKDLPLMMRKFGRFTGKMRAMAFEFKQGIDELGRQAELEELRREVQNLKAHTGLDELKKDFDDIRLGVERDVNASALPAPAATHPAIVAAAATPEPAAYAGLSAEHPGYDAGGDPGANGPSPEHVNGMHADGAHALGEGPGDPHIIPDDHAAPEPAPIKQDTPA